MPSTGGDTAGSRPNVVLINCDDLGYGDLGCYGSTLNATPALDRLAAEGLRFDDFYMASPVCSPSRGALLTGCYPPRIGFGSFDGLPVLFPGQPVGLPTTEISLARVLSDAGYRTQMVGKWHCGDQPGFLPTNHGFDHYFGLPYSNDMGRQAGSRTSDAPVTSRGYPPLPLLLDDEVLEQQPDQASLTERYVVEVVRFLRERRGDEPFFLYLAHLYVHVPIYVQERFARASPQRRLRRRGRVDRLGHRGRPPRAGVARPRRATPSSCSPATTARRPRRRRRQQRAAPRGRRAPRGRAACGCRASSAGPGTSSPAGPPPRWRPSMDLFPTLAAPVRRGRCPTDRTIDGRDITPLLLDAGATSPHESFLYYWMDDLRGGAGRPVEAAPGQARQPSAASSTTSTPTSARRPTSPTSTPTSSPSSRRTPTATGERSATPASACVGDRRAPDRPGRRRRRRSPTYDPDHPYYLAEYDLPDRG